MLEYKRIEHGAYPLAKGVSHVSALCCDMIIYVCNKENGDDCCIIFASIMVDAYVCDGGWICIHHMIVDYKSIYDMIYVCDDK